MKPDHPPRGIVAAALLIAACGSTDGGPRPVVRDSAGVRIVESVEPRAPMEAWTLAPEPRISIGVVQGEPEYQFTQIQNIGMLPDGGFFVAQLNGPPQVRIFDREGRHVRSIGREGSGPGELAGIGWADLLGGDTIRVYDFWASRITYFSVDGDLLGDTPIHLLAGQPANALYTQPGFANGDMVARPNRFVPRDAPRGLNRSTTYALRLGRTGEPIDSIGDIPDTDYFGASDRDIFLPFGRRAALLAFDSLLYVATGDAYEVRLHGPGGRLLAIHRRAGERRAVSDELIAAAREQALASASDDNARRRVERNFTEAPLPDRLPAYSRSMLATVRGELWVEHYLAPTDTVRTWDVFAPDGAHITTISVPLAFEPKQVTDDAVIGVWSDELDVETVRVYELRK